MRLPGAGLGQSTFTLFSSRTLCKDTFKKEGPVFLRSYKQSRGPQHATLKLQTLFDPVFPKLLEKLHTFLQPAHIFQRPTRSLLCCPGRIRGAGALEFGRVSFRL